MTATDSGILVPRNLISAESEASILGALMRDNARIDRVADTLSANDFGEEIFGRIYTAIVDCAMQGRPAKPMVIAQLFEGDAQFQELDGRKFLNEATMSLLSAAEPTSMVRHVQDLAVRRRMFIQMTASATMLADLNLPLDTTLADHDTALTSSVERAEANPFRGGHECISEVLATFDRPIIGVSSNGVVEAMDRLVGKMRPGWLGVLAARPGMGKTAVAVSYMRGTALAGHQVLFASLEMTWQMLSLRLAADHAYALGRPIPFSRITEGRLNPQQREIVKDIYHDLADAPFKIIDKQCHTLGQLRRAVRRRKRELAAIGAKLELVVVDYLQLLVPDGKAKSEYEAVSEVSRELKVMAGQEGVAVLALSQLSRNVEQRADKRPFLSDLRSSGQIEQDADFVMFLLSQEYYVRKEEPEPDTPPHAEWQMKLAQLENKLEFILAKYRHGPEGTFFGNFYRNYQAVR